jgi:hypothetical protein
MKHIAVVALGLATLGPFSLAAQRALRAPRAEPVVPFQVGERLTYDVSWASFLTAGTAVTTVAEKKPSYDSTAYYIVAEGRPTPLVAKIYPSYYKLDSLLDSYTLLPQRGSVYTEEGGRHRFRTTQFNRAANTVHFEYRTDTTATADVATSPYAQDALSAIYVLRTMIFKVGVRTTMAVSDSGINYTGQFEVGVLERVRTGAGDVTAWRVKLTLVDDQQRPVGRNLALWLSNDVRRLPVRLRAELPVGHFDLVLRDAR